MQQQEPSRNCWKEGPEWPLEGQQSQPKETSPSVRYPSGWATGMSPSGDSCRLQLAREAWNQDSRLSSPRRQKRCGLRERVDRSGRLCGLFQPQAVTVGQRSPNCRCWVDRRPACPCWLGGRRAMPGEGTAGFGFFCSTTHTHTPQGRGRGRGGAGREAAVGGECPAWPAFVPCGHRSGFRCPTGGVLASSGARGGQISDVCCGSDGGTTLEPLLFRGSRQAGLEH